MLKQEPKQDWIRGRGKPESSIYKGAISGSVGVGEAKGKVTGENRAVMEGGGAARRKHSELVKLH